MAIWQYSLFFIPRSALLTRYGEIPAQLEHNAEGWADYWKNTANEQEPEFEDAFNTNWWSERTIYVDQILPFLERFGTVQEWTKDAEDFRKYGDSSEHDITVVYSEQTKVIEELSCRLDISQLNDHILSTVTEIARCFDCLLMNSKAEVFEANVNKLFDHIKASNSNKFITNPQQFFDDLSSGKFKPE